MPRNLVLYQKTSNQANWVLFQEGLEVLEDDPSFNQTQRIPQG